MDETIQRCNGKLYLDDILDTEEPSPGRYNYCKVFALIHVSGVVVRLEPKTILSELEIILLALPSLRQCFADPEKVDSSICQKGS